MTRPVTTSKKRRVQVGPATSTPGLDVVAPMHVDTPPSAEAAGWAQLQNVLGVAGSIHKERKEFNDREAQEQGMADKRLGAVDAEREARETKYADGVEEASLITQTNAAIASVEERAAQELPADLPVDQKVAWIDAHLMKELGPLAADPKARRIIHEQYQDYLEKFAGRETAANRMQHQATVQEAMEVEIGRAVDGADVDLPALVNKSASVFPGGRTEAWQHIVDRVAVRAEEMHDESIIADLLPHKVTTEDGQTIDSPISSKINKARLDLARERIAKHKAEVEKPITEWTIGERTRSLEDRILAAEPISYAELEADVKRGWYSEERANSFVTRAANAVEERKKKDKEYDDKLVAFYAGGGKSWVDAERHPNGPENRTQSQELTDLSIQRQITGWAKSTGVEEIPLTGEQLRKHPEILAKILSDSSAWRLPYTPVKSYLAEINPSMGGTVLDRISVYESAKALGVESMYVDEDTQAILEVALTAKRAGEKDENIVATIQRMSDPATREWAKENREKAHKGVLRGKLDVVGRVFDVDPDDIGNLPFVQQKLKDLADNYLSRGLPPERSAELARTRFLDTHFAVEVNGKSLIVPESPNYDSAATQEALKRFQSLAPQFAAKQRDPNPEAASMIIVFGRNGRDVEVHYVGSDGLELNTRPMSIPAMIAQLRKNSGNGYEEAVKASREAQARRRWQERRAMDKAFGRDILPQPKL